MNLSLTSEQEVLEGHLLCIFQGQLEPYTQKASTAHREESCVVPAMGHNLVVGHEIHLESHDQHLKKKEYNK